MLPDASEGAGSEDSACLHCGGELINNGTVCARCGYEHCWRCHELYYPNRSGVCRSCGATWPGPDVEREFWQDMLVSLSRFPAMQKLVVAASFMAFVALVVALFVFV